MSAEIMFQLAAAALVASLLFSNIRIAKGLAFVAGLLATAGLFMMGNSVWLVWAAVFAAISGAQFALIFARSRRGWTSEEEEHLIRHILSIEDPRQQTRLRDVIQWRDLGVGDVVMKQGEVNPPLVYIAEGAAKILVDDHKVGECGPGDFLGEMSLVSGNSASAPVEVLRPIRFARFDRDALSAFVSDLPEIGKAIDVAVNRSLTAKIARMNQTAAATDKKDDSFS